MSMQFDEPTLYEYSFDVEYSEDGPLSILADSIIETATLLTEFEFDEFRSGLADLGFVLTSIERRVHADYEDIE